MFSTGRRILGKSGGACEAGRGGGGSSDLSPGGVGGKACSKCDTSVRDGEDVQLAETPEVEQEEYAVQAKQQEIDFAVEKGQDDAQDAEEQAEGKRPGSVEDPV